MFKVQLRSQPKEIIFASIITEVNGDVWWERWLYILCTDIVLCNRLMLHYSNDSTIAIAKPPLSITYYCELTLMLFPS
jgi:hypothetical protein